MVTSYQLQRESNTRPECSPSAIVVAALKFEAQQRPPIRQVGPVQKGEAFITSCRGVADWGPAMTGVLRCKYSDDDGHTWRQGADLVVRRTRFDHPDPSVPYNWIVWQKPVRDSRGPRGGPP